MYDAIILAGGESKQLSQYSPERYEALIKIAGKPMVTFVAHALRSSGQVDRIFVLGPAEALKACELPENSVVLDGGRTIMETIQIGMDALGHVRPVLVVTADIPLLTPEAVVDFLTQCVSAPSVDLYYPIVSKEVNERGYPGNKRTYVTLKEGIFTGGNIFLVNPAIVPRCLEVAEEIIAQRKNPLRLCKIVGWGFVVKFLLRRLSISEAEKQVSSLLGITGAVILSGYPEVGLDVDKPSDLELVQTAFAAKTNMHTLRNESAI
jgi:GTP:adenosylcobinamide-phosphate guanylyltransferase